MAIALIDGGGRCVLANRALEGLLGYGRFELRSIRWQELVHPDDVEETLDPIERLGFGRRSRDQFETRLVRKDGRVVWVRLIVSSAGEPAGRKGCLVALVQDITERKEAAEAHALAVEELCLSETRLRTMVANLPAAVYRCGPDGWTFRFVSDGIEQITGHPASDLIENRVRSMVSAIYQEDLTLVWAAVAEAIEKKKAWAIEYRVLHADGSIRWVLDTAQSVVDMEGALRCFDGVLIDITERKRAEQAHLLAAEELREIRKRFQTMVANVPAAIYRSRSDGCAIDFISDAIEEITGYAPSDFSEGRIPCLAALIHPADKPAVRTTVADGISRKKPFVAEYRICRADGSIRWVHERGQPAYDEKGWLRWVDGTIFDVTERRLAEDAFAESERRYRELIELAPELICIHCEGEIKYINPAGAKMLGAESPYVLIGRQVWDFVRPCDREVVEARIKKVVEEGAPQPYMEVKIVRLDGRVIDVESAGAPLTYEGRAAVQWVARDITERKLAEELLREPQGRRARLRARFMTAGQEAFSESEILELVLSAVRPRGNLAPLAERLLERFGSFAEVLSADPKRLGEVRGINEAAIVALKIVQGASLRLARDGIIDRPIVGSCSELLDYLRASMAYHKREHLRILFLDHKNKLIADELQQNGTVDHVPLYPREVIRRALELHASALILVHNHPSGDPTPSPADIEITDTLLRVGKSLGIAVHDHIVVTKGIHASFKSLGLL